MKIMWRQGENIKSMENESEEKMQRRNTMNGSYHRVRMEIEPISAPLVGYKHREKNKVSRRIVLLLRTKIKALCIELGKPHFLLKR